MAGNLSPAQWFCNLVRRGHLTPNSTNYVSAYAVMSQGMQPPTARSNSSARARDGGRVACWRNGGSGFGQRLFPSELRCRRYVKMPANASDEGEVGSYTYRRTGPETAELVSRSLLPRKDDGLNGSVLELTFMDAHNAAFTNLAGGSGTFSFAPTEESVPGALNGAVTVTTSFVNSNLFSTNTFGPSTFTATDNLGGSLPDTIRFPDSLQRRRCSWRLTLPQPTRSGPQTALY